MRQWPTADRRTKVHIRRAPHLGYESAAVVEGLGEGWQWALTRKGAERKARRVIERVQRDRRRRESTEEIVLDCGEAAYDISGDSTP